MLCETKLLRKSVSDCTTTTALCPFVFYVRSTCSDYLCPFKAVLFYALRVAYCCLVSCMLLLSINSYIWLLSSSVFCCFIMFCYVYITNVSFYISSVLFLSYTFAVLVWFSPDTTFSLVLICVLCNDAVKYSATDSWISEYGTLV